jgi:hypothetical protein
MATTTDTEAQAKIRTQLTDPFIIRWGLKQGDGLAPCLFNLAMENINRKLTVNVKETLDPTQHKLLVIQEIYVY